jgi:hypothetical protein
MPTEAENTFLIAPESIPATAAVYSIFFSSQDNKSFGPRDNARPFFLCEIYWNPI